MDVVSVGEVTDGTLTVVLRGDIDFTNAARVRETISSAVTARRPRAVRVEMGEVTFLDSSGVGVLVDAMKSAWEVEAGFRVVNPTPRVFDQLRIAGLLDAFGLG
ncbi:STAS domain-containing protein [Nonomuraea sp. NPDC049486]|uniref:STAS domain-containing protein n=1 Tax=Nonomuraea harbinensis TaxID=1286938 RepID=A0ABW1C6Z9_9ACTN|nr:STAS domain-containing protein [Nonomuraea harbinensis]